MTHRDDPVVDARPFVVLGVGGGIAAYKAAELLRLLSESGHDVTVVPTRAALKFVGAATWSALSGKPVSAEVWDDVHEVPHVRLGQEADCIVVEVNNGGEMCKSTLHAVDPSAPVEMVHASRGKHTRAEPVATAYETGETHHVGRALEKLEDEMCTWFTNCGWSPNRMDAGVWALSALETGTTAASAPYTPQDRPGLAGMET